MPYNQETIRAVVPSSTQDVDLGRRAWALGIQVRTLKKLRIRLGGFVMDFLGFRFVDGDL